MDIQRIINKLLLLLLLLLLSLLLYRITQLSLEKMTRDTGISKCTMGAYMIMETMLGQTTCLLIGKYHILRNYFHGYWNT